MRIDDPKEVDEEAIQTLLNQGRKVIVQFSEKIYSDKILEQIDKICRLNNYKFEVRFYWHDDNFFDCSILCKIPNVKSL